jgi:hypothetical protein
VRALADDLQTRAAMKKTALLVLIMGLAAAPAWAKPVAGTNELRLGPPFVPGLAITGINFYSNGGGSSGQGSDTVTLLSLGAGYGRFLSNHVEIGSGLGFTFLSAGGDSVSGPGIAPFVRVFTVAGNLGLFAEASVQYHSLSSSGSSVSIYGGGIDAGLEFFLAESWALRVAPGYRHLIASSSSNDPGSSPSAGEGANVFGVNWGIAAYF